MNDWHHGYRENRKNPVTIIEVSAFIIACGILFFGLV